MKFFTLACFALISFSAHGQVRALPVEDNAFIRHCEGYSAAPPATMAAPRASAALAQFPPNCSGRRATPP